MKKNFNLAGIVMDAAVALYLIATGILGFSGKKLLSSP